MSGRLGFSATVVLLSVTSLGQTALAQNAAAPESRRIRYFNREWSFNDVDVATLTGRLARIGLRVPVVLEGRISGTINVGVPWGALGDGRAWRLGGSLTSPQLTIERFVLRDVVIRLQYRDGSLHLDGFRVRLPPPQGAVAPVGLLTGDAEMELIPRGQLTASTSARDLPLSTLLQRVAALKGLGGSLSGSLTAKVNVDQLGDLAAWRISGPVLIKRLTAQNLPPAEASVRLELEKAVATAPQIVVPTPEPTPIISPPEALAPEPPSETLRHPRPPVPGPQPSSPESRPSSPRQNRLRGA